MVSIGTLYPPIKLRLGMVIMPGAWAALMGSYSGTGGA